MASQATLNQIEIIIARVNREIEWTNILYDNAYAAHSVDRRNHAAFEQWLAAMDIRHALWDYRTHWRRVERDLCK